MDIFEIHKRIRNTLRDIGEQVTLVRGAEARKANRDFDYLIIHKDWGKGVKAKIYTPETYRDLFYLQDVDIKLEFTVNGERIL